MCTEAGLFAIREERDYVLQEDIVKAARKIADKIAIMYKGRIIEQGSVEDVISNPKEEYTRKLIEDVPKL